MIWILYNILFTIGFILLLPKFFVRMWRRGGYRRHFLQRFGFYSNEVKERLASGDRIWIHAVSVGEMYVALRFMQEMRSRNPAARFVLTTTTSTGHAIGREKTPPEDVLLYFPVDVPPVTRRVLNRIRPKMVILVECEFWPNLIRYARRRGIPVALVNGRISDNSYRGYRKLRMFTRRLLPQIDLFGVQSENDRRRLVDLGAPEERVHVMGSAKYEVAERDVEGEQSVREVLRAAGIEDRHDVLLGGSTWPGEEAVLLDIYRDLKPQYPNLALILVPRHFERSDEVVREIEARGLPYVLRSRVSEPAPSGDSKPPVLLVDTTGELKHFYSCAGIIFIGKSLTDHGGQNIIEPALYARPILVGPHMENFSGVMEEFLESDAIFQVRDSEALKAAIVRLLDQSELRASYGDRAGRLVREKAGAVKKTVDELMK